jgi:hypothetical protein
MPCEVLTVDEVLNRSIYIDDERYVPSSVKAKVIMYRIYSQISRD